MNNECCNVNEFLKLAENLLPGTKGFKQAFDSVAEWQSIVNTSVDSDERLSHSWHLINTWELTNFGRHDMSVYQNL